MSAVQAATGVFAPGKITPVQRQIWHAAHVQDLAQTMRNGAEFAGRARGGAAGWPLSFERRMAVREAEHGSWLARVTLQDAPQGTPQAHLDAIEAVWDISSQAWEKLQSRHTRREAVELFAKGERTLVEAGVVDGTKPAPRGFDEMWNRFFQHERE